MHRPKTERQALAHRLLGTAETPGPIDVGWMKRRYGVEGSHIKRWRESGIPAARVDDLEAAILDLTAKDAHPDKPEWASDMESRILKAIRRLGDVQIVQGAAVELGLDAPQPDEPASEEDAMPPGSADTAPPHTD